MPALTSISSPSQKSPRLCLFCSHSPRIAGGCRGCRRGEIAWSQRPSEALSGAWVLRVCRPAVLPGPPQHCPKRGVWPSIPHAPRSGLGARRSSSQPRRSRGRAEHHCSTAVSLDGAAVSALREDSRARARWVTAVRQVTGSTGGRRSSHNGGCVQPDRLESCAPCCPGGRTPAAAAPRHSGGSTAPQRGQPPGCCPRNGVPRGHAPVAAGGRDRYPARGRWSRR